MASCAMHVAHQNFICNFFFPSPGLCLHWVNLTRAKKKKKKNLEVNDAFISLTTFCACQTTIWLPRRKRMSKMAPISLVRHQGVRKTRPYAEDICFTRGLPRAPRWSGRSRWRTSNSACLQLSYHRQVLTMPLSWICYPGCTHHNELAHQQFTFMSFWSQKKKKKKTPMGNTLEFIA